MGQHITNVTHISCKYCGASDIKLVDDFSDGTLLAWCQSCFRVHEVDPKDAALTKDDYN